MTTAPPLTLHASCVDLDGQGLLILGAAGRGKSALALQMLALGARLVADDRTEIRATPQGLTATCPPAILGLIEARGIGILRVDPIASTRLKLVVDLDQTEDSRLPPQRKHLILGQSLDLVLGSQSAHFPAALICYLVGSRQH